MEKKVTVSILCQLYGVALTEKQFIAINDYYNNDLSLSEIAENLEITRQAVRDNIIQAEKKLYEYEEKFKLMENKSLQQERKNKLLAKVDKFEKKQMDLEVTRFLQKIKKDIEKI